MLKIIKEDCTTHINVAMANFPRNFREFGVDGIPSNFQDFP
jgi:hypothetical protein